VRLAFCVRAIFPQHGYGGLERAASGLLCHLLLRGIDLTLYTRPLPASEPLVVEPHEDADAQAIGHIAVRSARYGRLPLRPNGIPARLTNYRAFVDDMGRQVRAAAIAGRAQGIYAQGLCAWGVRHAAEWGVPSVANPQGMEEFKVADPLKRLAYAPFRAWLRTAYRAADRVIATDYSMQNEVSSLLGVDPARVVVIPNGIDVNEAQRMADPLVQFELGKRWPGLAADHGTLLGISVGRMESNKGFDHLLRALGAVQSQLGEGWRWFLVGDGSLKPQLEQMAGKLGLADRVLFTGKVSDIELHSLYAMCNLFTHPTLYEGSSLVTLEAMAHSLPAVASATGGIPDKVIDGQTGFLVAPGDDRALAEKIRWMSAHPHERAAMGRRGFQLAQEHFSWTQVATRTEQLFYELIDEKTACRGQEVAAGSC
jgi:glycogen(starch) synthase